MARGTKEKLYYSISEVAEMLGVKAHVLRYWETEFPVLAPPKNRAGNRSYRQSDVKIALAIKRLLYDEGYTIAGARKQLTSERRTRVAQAEIPFTAGRRRGELRRLRDGLRELHELLQD